MNERLKQLVDSKSVPTARKLAAMEREIEGLEAVVATAGTLLEQCQDKVSTALSIMTEEQKIKFFAKIGA